MRPGTSSVSAVSRHASRDGGPWPRAARWLTKPRAPLAKLKAMSSSHLHFDNSDSVTGDGSAGANLSRSRREMMAGQCLETLASAMPARRLNILELSHLSHSGSATCRSAMPARRLNILEHGVTLRDHKHKATSAMPARRLNILELALVLLVPRPEDQCNACQEA
jgi:hypothetical protein